MERIASEQSRPQKAAYLEGAHSLRHALGKLSLERHSLKPVNEEDDPDVQQVEMLLQAYFIQMDNTFNQLETMNEYISDTEVIGQLGQIDMQDYSSVLHFGGTVPQYAAGTWCMLKILIPGA